MRILISSFLTVLLGSQCSVFAQAQSATTCGGLSYLGYLAPGKCEPVDGEIISKKTAECANGLYSPTGEYRRTTSKKKKPHRGIDLAAPIGETVYSASAGSLFDVATLRKGGLVVGIKHADRHISRYFHLDSTEFTTDDIGDQIEAGKEIAEVGVSGNASPLCPHLHFEIRAAGYENDDPRTYSNATLDPQLWLRAGIAAGAETSAIVSEESK